MLDIECLIKAKRVICLRNSCKTTQVPGKSFLKKNASHQLEDAFFSTVISTPPRHCAKLKTSLPNYYKESLNAWSELNGITPGSSLEVIINEIIWKNKFLCIDEMSVYREMIPANNSPLYNASVDSLVSP